MNVIPILPRFLCPRLKSIVTATNCHRFAVLAAAFLAVSTCPGVAATNIVRMVGTSFDPKFLTNNPGDTIIWTNTSTFIQHNVVSSNSVWADSALFSSPGTFRVTLNTPGAYGYYCRPHRTTMTGIIYVRAANQAPVVSLTDPPSGLTLASPAAITLKAAASDPDGTVTEVQFFSGSTLLSTVSSPPYVWGVLNLAAGNYSFTARARDNAGASTTSGAVNLSVVTAAPPHFQPSLAAMGGELSLRVSVTPGLGYEISSTTDLSNWANFTNFTASQPVMNISVPTAGPDRRFFRARLLPNP